MQGRSQDFHDVPGSTPFACEGGFPGKRGNSLYTHVARVVECATLAYACIDSKPFHFQ